jgi:small-conductance mechanosensitive channel
MYIEFLEKILFQLGDIDIRVSNLLLWTASVLGLCLFYWVLRYKRLPNYISGHDIEHKAKRRLYILLSLTLVFSLLLLTILCFGLDYDLTPRSDIDFKISYLLFAAVVFQIARIFDWFTANIFIHNAFVNKKSKPVEVPVANTSHSATEEKVSRIGKWFVYIMAVNLLIQVLNIDYTIFKRTLTDDTVFNFKVSNILIVLLIFFGTKLMLWIFTQIVLRNIYLRNNITEGAAYAINQLIKYIVWTVAIFVSMNALGIDVTLLLGGAAALLVGVGLGLQSTFNDFIAGIVLLFERSVKVGDMLETNNTVGRVTKIGMRSSIIETRGFTSVIVPNSQLVNQDVINWTYDSDKVRFLVKVGVAYGTDTNLVKTILLEKAKANPYIISYPAPFVRFEDFGESSLDFSLYFFSRNYIVIEDIKSDLRFEIDIAFREHNIQIPFPQRDLHIIRGAK